MEVCGKQIRFRGRLVRIAYLDAEGYRFLDDPDAALALLRRSQPRADLFTFIQRLSNRSPEHDYPMEPDNFAVLPVSTFDEWITHQIRFKARNKIRKAEKMGVSAREAPFDDDLIRGIHAIYNESPTRQGRRFWHYGKDFEAVRSTTATFLDQSIFIGAFFQGEMIGFAKLVADEKRTQAGLMHIVAMNRHRDLAPNNALVARAVAACAERNIPSLWYAHFSYGKREGDTLADFKRHNGFEKVEVPRYYVPLTLAGRAALRLGLHHSLLELVPAPAIMQYRKIRNLWYSRKFAGLESA
ncbi:MAG: hypothetical protein EPN47_03505 [Acidobacteria bacterium]|nr:MAG: hypothetical protein EPN47_03505 [Acidobacteriota bacterium]